MQVLEAIRVLAAAEYRVRHRCDARHSPLAAFAYAAQVVTLTFAGCLPIGKASMRHAEPNWLPCCAGIAQASSRGERHAIRYTLG